MLKIMYEGDENNFDVFNFDYDHEISAIILCLILGLDFYLSPRNVNNGCRFCGLMPFLVIMGHTFMLPQLKMFEQVPPKFSVFSFLEISDRRKEVHEQN